MQDDYLQLINPIVPTSIQHNTKTLSQLRNLTASLFGIAAGILGLEAAAGFLFYLVGTLVVSALVAAFLARGRPADFFGGVGSDDAPGAAAAAAALWRLCSEDVVGGLSSFVLTWTLFFGLVRA